MILPNALIAGAPKSGTSSVHQWLADHPDCVGSHEKETYFLSDPDDVMYRPDHCVARGLETYAAEFPEAAATARVVLESTPSYLYSQTAVTTITAFPTPPKVLFILREPASQIFSLFRYFQNNWSWVPSDMSFSDFLDAVRNRSHDFGGHEMAQNAIENASYVSHLDQWRAVLPDGHMRVRLFDDVLKDERGFMRDLAQWLDLDPAFYDSYDFPRENETYAPRSHRLQRINVSIRSMLPKGRTYDALRGLYRRLNTTKPGPRSPADDTAMRELRGEFAVANAQLAQTYNLDLSAWQR